MSVEAAALAAGESVAKIAARRWLAGRAAKAAASAELIDLIKTGPRDEITRRGTKNQFEALAVSVAQRLQPYTRHELRGLDDGTRESALFEGRRSSSSARPGRGSTRSFSASAAIPWPISSCTCPSSPDARPPSH